MPRRARVNYLSTVRLGDNKIAHEGDLVILKTDDDPRMCRIHGYPVFEIGLMTYTSVDGTRITLIPVKARGRGMYDRNQSEDARAWRLVTDEDGVERID